MVQSLKALVSRETNQRKQIVPDGAEEVKNLGTHADSDLGNGHVMHQAIRGLGLHQTQMPEEV